MWFLQDLSRQCSSLFDDLIKVIHFEPEYDAVRERCSVRVVEVWVLVLVPGVEL
jgi:hypothetical protein